MKGRSSRLAWWWLCLGSLGSGLQSPSAAAQDAAPAPAAAPRGDAELVLEGAKFFSKQQIQATLRVELQEWKEGRSAPIVADDCAYELEQAYLAEGFEAVLVHVQVLDKPPGLAFKIEEGARALIAEWSWPGAVAAPGLNPNDLAALYGTEDPLPFVQARLQSLPSKVEDQYRAQGYLDAHVDPAEVTALANPSQRRLVVRVTPGTRYRLAECAHDLDPAIAAEAKLDAALRAVYGPADAHPFFQPRWMPQWVRAAEHALGQAGYLDARVQADWTTSGDEVRVQLHIQPGQTVRLGSIVLPEELHVRDRFVLHHMGLQPGQTLTPKELDDAVMGLYRTGRFGSVRLTLEGEGAERDLRVDLSEQAQREAFIEPGYGSFEGLRLRGGIRYHNIGGVARSLRVEGVVAERARRVLVGWNDPWTLGNDWILDVNWDSSLRKLPAFTRTTTSLSAFASRSFGEHFRWTTDVGLRNSFIAVSDVRVDLLGDPASDGIRAEDLTSSTLEWGLAYDSRNHPLLPRSGQLASLNLQYALAASGTTPRYTQVQLGWSGYRRLGKRQTLAVGMRAAAILPEGDGALPLGLRLFSGGENTVRSFREDELGPTDASGTPLGGEGRSTLSVELLQDLGDSHWQAAAFVDLGNVVDNASDLFRARDVETALGLGIRYVLPIGPVRMDWGFNPNATDSQPQSVLYISVGMAF
ncbi:MAG: BamA/TamA family outer membrane protein [Planctomycetes bacterium]|nr:BamA/TamA family outer membrane protein [Planctomycetota bacterium]MCB9909123.1 BamA/TamA family outer membrane protein [Planctomycetota bacterium]MCB9911627.1 BamA/TamA family outer membrane protein [Planctomycetota bacterium]